MHFKCFLFLFLFILVLSQTPLNPTKTLQRSPRNHNRAFSREKNITQHKSGIHYLINCLLSKNVTSSNDTRFLTSFSMRQPKEKREKIKDIFKLHKNIVEECLNERHKNYTLLYKLKNKGKNEKLKKGYDWSKLLTCLEANNSSKNEGRKSEVFVHLIDDIKEENYFKAVIVYKKLAKLNKDFGDKCKLVRLNKDNYK